MNIAGFVPEIEDVDDGLHELLHGDILDRSIDNRSPHIDRIKHRAAAGADRTRSAYAAAQ